MRKVFILSLTKAALRQQGSLVGKHVDEFVYKIKIRGAPSVLPVDLVDLIISSRAFLLVIHSTYLRAMRIFHRHPKL